MEINQQRIANREVVVKAVNGWPMVGLFLLLLAFAVAGLLYGAIGGQPAMLGVGCVLVAATVLGFTGLFSLQPNEARVLILFGQYKGTVRDSGLHWVNPFYSNGDLQFTGRSSLPIKFGGRNKLSLRARTLNGERIK